MSEVDLEARTAICAVDGPVSIYVSGMMRRCTGALKDRETEPLPPPAGQHRMLQKDVTAKIGVCALCGPVSLRKQKGAYRCENSRYTGEQLKMKTALRQALRDGKPCEICGRPGQVLDHEHGSKTWRGVLCQKHNTGLGMFDDDPELLQAAINYLQK